MASHLCCYARKEQVGDALGLEEVSQVCRVEGSFARLVQQFLPLCMSVQHCRYNMSTPIVSCVCHHSVFMMMIMDLALAGSPESVA
jgi:hypothetical protein